MNRKNTLLLPALVAAGIGTGAQAAEIQTNTAQMQAMDKITGRVSVINVPVNTETKFGSFSIVVRDCRTRSPEETPENFAFVDVADTSNEGEQFNIFKGWMLSSTPALNAIEHPVYDVWLLKCIDTDLTGVQTLSSEELVARDALPMKRAEKRTSADDSGSDFTESNLSGEPIDLLPAAIREAGEESAAQEEIIPFKEAESGEREPAGDISLPPADENMPHSLLNIPAETEDGAPQDIRNNIVIKENTSETEISSDARVLNKDGELTENPAGIIPGMSEENAVSVEELPTIAPGQQKTDTISGSNFAPAADSGETVLITGSKETPAETAPRLSEETLKELEQELSRELN